MTVDEITDKIMEFGDLHSLSGAREEIYCLITQVSPREVTEDELTGVVLFHGWGRPAEIRIACEDSFSEGARWALRLNTMAKLESLFPSFYEAEKWMKHDFYPTHGRDPRLEELHSWIKSRVLGGEK